jgi:predicted O-methyltransferase YrrM
MSIMNALKKIADRLLPPRFEHPASPVDAENSFHSWIFSADDDVQPSLRLLRLALDATEAAHARVSLDDLAVRRNIPEYFTCWPGEHYRLLAGLVQVLQPKTLIEVGTSTGLSAITMLKYLRADGRLATFDVQNWDTFDDTILTKNDFADGRLTQHVGNLADAEVFDRHRELIASAEFIFIDGPKDNVFEYRFMELLRSIRFERPPILMFDDTRLWSMLRFWRQLPYPKMDMTSFGHWSGTGLVEFLEH